MIAKGRGVILPDAVVVSAAELAEVIGTDLLTLNNWIRRGIIRRTPIGGRQVKSRLFANEEVYKAALTNELVKLGLPPSSASDAVNTLWKDWDRRELPGDQKLYAIVLPIKGKLTVALCSQKKSRGALYRFKFGGNKSSVEIELPHQAFAVIPISDVLESANSRMSELLLGTAKSRFSRA
jgi:hypothetical protein